MPDAKLVEAISFGRCILDGDDMDYERYMRIASEVERGLYVEVTDPFERAVAAVFQLVIEEDMDPWKIDLREFAVKYMEKIRADERVDLITAGKLIRLAWEVLKRKSDMVVEKITAQMAEPEEVQVSEDEMEVLWEAFDAFPVMDECGDDVGEMLIVEPPLVEPVRREEPAPVSILDLLRAVERIRVDYEKRKAVRERRERMAQKMKFNVEEKVHREDLEDEISEVWDRLLSLPTSTVLFSELHNNTREDVVKCFTSLLFLYKREKVDMHQDYPFGEMEIEVRSEEKHALEQMPGVGVEA
jgi:segregation and condensation protein A